MNVCSWEESKWEDASEGDMRSWNWVGRSVCNKEEGDLSIVERRERRDVWIHWWTIEKRIY